MILQAFVGICQWLLLGKESPGMNAAIISCRGTIIYVKTVNLPNSYGRSRSSNPVIHSADIYLKAGHNTINLEFDSKYAGWSGYVYQAPSKHQRSISGIRGWPAIWRAGWRRRRWPMARCSKPMSSLRSSNPTRTATSIADNYYLHCTPTKAASLSPAERLVLVCEASVKGRCSPLQPFNYTTSPWKLPLKY